MRTFTVVGAGLAGLVSARELVLQGHAVRVLEAADTVGGQLASAEVAGRRIDVGALQLDGTDDAVASLLARVDHAPSRVTANTGRWWLSTPSGVHPLPAVHWWGVPATPLAAETVAIVGRRAAWRGMLDALLPGPRGATVTTLEQLVRVRMGAGIADRLVAPVVEAQSGAEFEGVPAGDARGLRHRMLQQNSLARAVTSLRLDQPENAELVTLTGGPSVLVTALQAELERFGVPIELGTRVDDITDEGAVVDGQTLDGEIVLAAPLKLVHGADRTIVTLVLDTSAVPVGARGSGVLAERRRPDGVRRVLDLSALWPSLVDGEPDCTVLRIEGSATTTIEVAVQAVSELWESPNLDAAVLGAHAATWTAPGSWQASSPLEHPSSIVAVVGEHSVGPGIAHVIRTTIETIASLAPDAPQPISSTGDAEV